MASPTSRSPCVIFPDRPRRCRRQRARCRSARAPLRGETLLQVKAARKSFGGLVVVNDLSFTKNSGEIRGLIGSNGGGKST